MFLYFLIKNMHTHYNNAWGLKILKKLHVGMMQWSDVLSSTSLPRWASSEKASD